MRVCDLTTLWLDGGQGGVNTYLTEKARYLAGRPEVASHLIVVPGRRTERRAFFRSTLVTLAAPRLPTNPAHRVLTCFREIRRLLELEAPTVIEVDCSYFLGRVAAQARQAADAPIIGFYHVHLPTFIARPSAKARLGRAATGLAERLAWSYVRRCNRHCDRMVVTSRDIQQRLSREGFGGLEHVPLGVNLDLFRPPSNGHARERNGRPVDILYVGRLSLEKDLGVLIEAYRLLSRRGRYRLTIVGDGPLRAGLERAAAGMGVRFLGECPYGPELARLYAASDLLATPSPNETFNLTLLEAFASGLPVVSVSQGGPTDLVGAGRGELARPGDAGDFAAKIERVASHGADYKGGREHVERGYSWERCFDALLEVYRSAVRARNG